jgi:hypothetical protein
MGLWYCDTRAVNRSRHIGRNLRHSWSERTRLVPAAVAALVSVLAGSCTTAPAPVPPASTKAFPSIVPSSRARIAALWLFPYPEGPPQYFCPHPKQMIGISTCVRLYRSWITDALGDPVAWPASTPSTDCESRWTMKVILADRTRLLYGPCEQAAGIVSLRDALVQAAASQ